jgi:hypothetical protein
VIFKREPTREKVLQSSGAPLEVINAIAFMAVKVVVVMGSDLSEFVAGRLARNLNGVDFTRFFERAQRPIDGAQAE